MSEDAAVKSLKLTDKVVAVEWSDGHKSDFDYKYLRINCGCAECVEEWSHRTLWTTGPSK